MSKPTKEERAFCERIMTEGTANVMEAIRFQRLLAAHADLRAENERHHLSSKNGAADGVN